MRQQQQNAGNTNFLAENINSTRGVNIGSSTLGGHAAEKLEYNGVDNKNKLTKTMNIITMKDNKIYLFVYSSSKANYDKYLPVISNMTNSIMIK